MTSDDQPTQPLTDAELSAIRGRSEATEDPSMENSYGAFADSASDVPRLLAEVHRLRAENAEVKTQRDGFQKMMNSAVSAGVTIDGERLDALREVRRLETERDALGSRIDVTDIINETIGDLASQHEQLQKENEQLRLELAQTESGAHIAMDAGVVALQEVKRLEKVCADLKEINDRMAEDRLRLVDERDRLIAERETDAGALMAHRAKIKRLQSERAALLAKLGLDWGPDEFGDLSVVHVQSIEINNCPDEYCPGWKDSGICPNDFRHRF